MRKLVTVIIVIALDAVVAAIQSAPGAGRGFLIDKHVAAKLECAACHTEKPPAKQPDWTTTCLKCHADGDYNKLSDLTKKADPNPHTYHGSGIASDGLDERSLPCQRCHHVHRASELYCNLCHEFKLKTP